MAEEYGTLGAGKGVIKVSGVESTIKRLQGIIDMGERQLAQAVMAGSLVVNDEAKGRCPYITGNLRRSIHPELVSHSSERAEVMVGTDVVYAPYVEMGTARRAAKPYLRPALNEHRDDVRSSVQNAWQDILQKNARGGA
jgi:HK97 gp10 family phage protein